MTRPMTNLNFSLPRWGRAGVGARGLHFAAALPAPLAPIPTFPRKGKEQDR
ncbi:hypothetical protein SAMN03159363_3378 [Variovorax sp. EL159]|nr:hypothetical protein SAMN03159363_3378 [Variovorax sp. EL159]